jgi:hypothetical protein
MKALWHSIQLWWQALRQDKSEDAPFPLTSDEWAVIQRHEATRQAIADAKALMLVKVH